MIVCIYNCKFIIITQEEAYEKFPNKNFEQHHKSETIRKKIVVIVAN